MIGELFRGTPAEKFSSVEEIPKTDNCIAREERKGKARKFKNE